MYLPVRHDEVGKSLYNAIIQEDQPSHEYVLPKTEIWQSEKIELWWDTVVKMTPKVKHNKPDIVMWNKEDHQCFVIDVCVPLDENVKANEKIKRDRYMPLQVGLKRWYPEYSFSIVPIVIGATGLVTNSLFSHLKEIGFDKKDMKTRIPNTEYRIPNTEYRICN